MTARMDFDVVIVGGGMVGALLAALLATQPETEALTIALLEPNPARRLLNEPIDLRVSALSRAAEALLRQIGAWPQIEARGACAYERMMVWDAASPANGADTLLFDAAEVGEPNLGTIAENLSIAAAALDRAQQAGVKVYTSALQGLLLSPDAADVTIDGRVLKARLVVAADGADSPTRRFAGLSESMVDYPQHAVIAHLVPERPHEQVARQRFLATGPLALLPLADGRVSLVWSTTPDEATALLHCDEATFSARVTQASDSVLGQLTLSSPRAAWPLRRFNASRYQATRVALVGDAAHLVHPLAGQGVNQGFLDARRLAAEIGHAVQAKEDIGDARCLGRYARARGAENALMGAALDGLYRLFTAPATWIGSARRKALGVVQRLAPVKHVLIKRALGLS